MPSPRLLAITGFAPVAAVALAVAGCGLTDDGPRRSEARDVAGFTRIENRDSVDVRLRVGEPQRVRVRAGEQVIDDVRTEVRNGTLRVDFDHDGVGGSDVVVEASVPDLRAVDVDGSGDVDVEGIDARALDVRADGSADVALAGSVARLTLDKDGSGDVDLADLAARTARVAAGGSGDTSVRADDRLAVTVDGSGDVSYHGDPALTQQVDGSGDLRRAD